MGIRDDVVNLTNVDHSLEVTSTIRPKERHRIRAAINMAAIGLSAKDISDQLGLPMTRVDAILKSPEACGLINDIQDKIYIKNFPGMVQKLVPKAMKTIVEVLDCSEEKGATRLEAAKTILDRAMGKPQQTIEHKGSQIRELFEQLDLMKKSKTIDLKASDQKIDDKTDIVATWAAENLDEDKS